MCISPRFHDSEFTCLSAYRTSFVRNLINWNGEQNKLVSKLATWDRVHWLMFQDKINLSKSGSNIVADFRAFRSVFLKTNSVACFVPPIATGP